MISHILLATDFSARSDRALRRATMLAGQLGAGLSLVHVVDDDQPAHLVTAQVDVSRSMLEETIRTLAGFDGLAADAHTVTGDAYTGILAAADAAEADLIVLGPHRRQLRDIFVGTTAERTIAHSRRPVLMVAGAPTAPYNRGLVALELDERSREVGGRVQDMGLFPSGELVAVHAFDAPARGMMKRALAEQESIDQYVLNEGLRAGEALSRFIAEAGIRAARQRAVPIAGSAARTILECAREEDAGLIVVGTRQRTGIKRLILGSVAEDVLEEADRDVLVIPG